MPLLDRNGWKTEEYSRDDAGGAAVIVPLEALDVVLGSKLPGQRVGVDIPNNAVPHLLELVQGEIDLIAVQFPKFNDGRGFSLGRMLREQGYRGLLRATGKIVPDQFHFALRCGFDEVELSEEQAARQPIEQWLRGPLLFSAAYQDDQDGTVPVFRRRKAAVQP